MSQDGFPTGVFDVAVIGAGVVGCAIARRFTLEGARVIVIEKALDILDGASKGNSAILHTGFDAPPGSLELACIKAGYAEYLEIHERLNLPLLRSGAMVLAWTDEQEAALPALMEQARTNGIADVQAADGARGARAGAGHRRHAAGGVPGTARISRRSLVGAACLPAAGDPKWRRAAAQLRGHGRHL